MPHDHHHHSFHSHHNHSHGARTGWKLGISIVANLAITIAEIIGGIVSGSLALLSDAVHNFSDTSSLAISYAALKYSERDADERRTFGYKRVEIVGAFINLVTLVIISCYLIYEAVERFFSPREIDGKTMLIVAAIGLIGNLVTALLLHREAKESLNIRSAYLHIIGDAVSSVGVILGGVLIVLYNFTIIDPIITCLIAGYLLYHCYHMLKETADILMNAAPPNINLAEVSSEVCKNHPTVLDVHHLHVWRIDERDVALEAHVVIDENHLVEMEEIKSGVKKTLVEEFGIHHSTLEFETVPCEAPESDCFQTDPTSFAASS